MLGQTGAQATFGKPSFPLSILSGPINYGLQKHILANLLYVFSKVDYYLGSNFKFKMLNLLSVYYSLF